MVSLKFAFLELVDPIFHDRKLFLMLNSTCLQAVLLFSHSQSVQLSQKEDVDRLSFCLSSIFSIWRGFLLFIHYFYTLHFPLFFLIQTGAEGSNLCVGTFCELRQEIKEFPNLFCFIGDFLTLIWLSFVYIFLF